MKKETKKKAKEKKKILFALLDHEYTFTELGTAVRNTKQDALQLMDDETQYDHDVDEKGKQLGNVQMLELEVVAEYYAVEEVVLNKI